MYSVPGCTDSHALNYLSSATVDDDSCVPRVMGCTDPMAANYNSNANVNLPAGSDGACTYLIRGCTDSTALNYLPESNTDDDGCILQVRGCTSPLATNYDSLATVGHQQCAYAVTGCTKSHAMNYLSQATEDDNSCIALAVGCMAPAAMNFDSMATRYYGGTCRYSVNGCMSSSAINFNPSATVNDDSCVPGREGCIFPQAANFDVAANMDDGSCTFAPVGCDDSVALNYVAGAVPPVFNAAAAGADLDAIYADVLGAINEKRMQHCSSHVVWDDSLAAGALSHARSCPTGPSSATGSYFGEMVRAGASDLDATDVVAAWHSGVDSYPFGHGDTLSLANVSRWADFAQLVWKASVRVGCGWTSASDECSTPVWVCRFSPGGGYLSGFEDNVTPLGTRT